MDVVFERFALHGSDQDSLPQERLKMCQMVSLGLERRGFFGPLAVRGEILGADVGKGPRVQDGRLRGGREFPGGDEKLPEVVGSGPRRDCENAAF